LCLAQARSDDMREWIEQHAAD